MSRIFAMPLALVLAITLLAASLQAQGKGSDSVIKATAQADKPGADGKQTVTITLDIEENWHAYANPLPEDFPGKPVKVTVETTVKPKQVKVDYPKGKEIKDPTLGAYQVYEGKKVIKVTLERAQGDSGPLKLRIDVQACSDKQKICLVPATIQLKVP